MNKKVSPIKKRDVKRSFTLTFGCFSLLALSACGSNENDKGTIKKPEAAVHSQEHTGVHNTSLESASQDKEQQVQSALDENSLSGSPFPKAKTSVLINGKKMTLTAVPLQKGDTVFDHSVKENARATGDFVAVLQKGKVMPASWASTFSTELLAERTYKLTPRSSKDLLTTYTALAKVPEVESVELSLFYGPTDSRETM